MLSQKRSSEIFSIVTDNFNSMLILNWIKTKNFKWNHEAINAFDNKNRQ